MTDFLIKTVIKDSSIKDAGTGRFFLEDLKKGTIIRKQIIGSDNLKVIKNKEELDNYDITLLKHFGHSKPKNSKLNTNYIYLNNPTMNTNHSDNYNIDFEYRDNEKITYLIKDVKCGDEMLQNYCNYEKVDWFEEYLHERQLISQREFALSINHSK
jgi:hypothetical protein